VSRGRRIRQHKNPLSFTREVEVPDWQQVFADPGLPLEVDVGCAQGDFLLECAARRLDTNFVGLELRRGWVDRVQGKITRGGLTNACVVLCNANTSFSDLFAPASLQAVYVHFPDPWFKKKHHKRRVFTPALLVDLSERLVPGGLLRFLTDYGDYAREVVKLVEAHPDFDNPHGPGAPEPLDPERIQTHREAWHQAQGHEIHRYVWRRR
jgi:tRNA (guanine-N7-)-methyltransferase